MTYKPTPTLNTTVGENRAWTVDTEALAMFAQMLETLERIQQQLALITDVDIRPGEKLSD